MKMVEDYVAYVSKPVSSSMPLLNISSNWQLVCVQEHNYELSRYYAINSTLNHLRICPLTTQDSINIGTL